MHPRERLSLDGLWQLSPAAQGAPTLPVPVPAPWQAVPELRHFAGPAWYQREFTFPAAWLDGRLVILGFGAVDYLAEVWVNGRKAGEHEGGYLPFELDITSFIHTGTNHLQVVVSDPPELFLEIPHGKQSWYGPLSGIWQPVWLESRHPAHFQQVKITPHLDGMTEIALRISQPLASGAFLRAAIFGPPDQAYPEGVLVAQLETTQAHFTLQVEQPHLWDTETPNLYQLRLSLHAPNGASLDACTEHFGFRRIAARDGKLWLNDRPLYLRAALDQDYYPELICTPPSQEYIEAEFRQAKAMGLNCLRVHIKIADPRYYAAADRVGLLIWSELPNWNRLTAAARQRAWQTLQDMLERDWNHPSLVIWTIINESWGIDLTDPAQRKWLLETYQALKALDPHRLVVDNSACWGNFHLASDLDDFHNYYAMPDHADRWVDWLANFASRPWWSYAHAYPGHAAWQAFRRDPWNSPPQPPAPEVQRRGIEPLLVSEFGNWGLPDVAGLLAAYQGEPWWFDSGLEWGDGVVYPHGVEQRFAQYYLRRAFAGLDQLSKASQNLQVTALKYQIEQLRSHASLQGYVITEFTDVHWECNGLLDMLRRPKAGFARLAQFNADDLIIPCCHRLALRQGEECCIELALSHYSPRDLQGSRLTWQVVGFPDCHGQLSGLQPQPYTVTPLGMLQFIVPGVSESTRTRLELNLFDSQGCLVASNDQELVFFTALHLPLAPSAHRLYTDVASEFLTAHGFQLTSQLAEADLALVSELTDAERQYLQAGGQVLWLAESSAALQTSLGSLQLLPRQGSPWQGDWASSLGWLSRDILFSHLPDGGVMDFAYAGLTPECVLGGFTPAEFATEVHAGLFVGWLHRPVPTVAERRVGQGRLLICTFRLNQALSENPLAQQMLMDLLRYGFGDG